jgi:hypothetical protein
MKNLPFGEGVAWHDVARAATQCASGSQHKTISTISHRIAHSLSESAPIGSAT